VPLADCCKAQGVSEQSYYRWRTEAAAGQDDTERQLREVTLEAERLRRALADVMLDNQMLREVAKKKW
jgi:putative transposase